MTIETAKTITRKILSIKDNRLFLVFIVSILIFSVFLHKLGASYLSFLSMRFNDSAAYISMARAFSDSGHFISNLIYPCLINTPYTRFYMPGYYIVLATSNYLFGASIYSWILPSVISYIISGTLIYSIGNKLYNKNIALLAAIIFLLNPLIILLSMTAMSELTIIAVCLSAFYIFISTPDKLKYLAFPALISLIFLFRQTTVLVAIPMLAVVMQNNSETNTNKWLWLVNIFFTLLLLFTIDKWQISEGMRPFVFQDLFSAKNTENVISIGNIISHLSNPNYLFKYMPLVFSNYLQNVIVLKSWLISPYAYNPTDKYFISLIISSIFLSLIICFKKRPLDFFSLSIILMYIIVFNACLFFYTGTLNTVNRVSLFVFPFIAINLANAFFYITNLLQTSSGISGYLKKQNIALILFLLLNLFGSIHYFRLFQQDLHSFVVDETKREQFITNLHPDKTQLFVGPVAFCGGFIYKNYPVKFSFVPRDYDTLVLLEKKYHIGSILFTNDPSTNLTAADFEKTGFILTQKTVINGAEYALYQNSAA